MNIQNFAKRHPAVFGILAISVVMFLVSFAAPQVVTPALTFKVDSWTREPWTLFSYILAWPISGIFPLIYLVLTMLFFGTQLEIKFGTAWFLKLFTVAVLAGPVIGVIISMFGQSGVLMTPWVATSLVLIAWCGFFRYEVIRLCGVIPITAPALALITAAFLTFGTLSLGQIGSVMLAIPAVLFWLYSTGVLPLRSPKKVTTVSGTKVDAAAKRKAQREREYLDRVQDKVKEREERERLRKLFESSLKDDPDAKNG